MHRTATHCKIPQHTATHCSTRATHMKHTFNICNTCSRYSRACTSSSTQSAPHCTTLQHTCNKLHHCSTHATRCNNTRATPATDWAERALHPPHDPQTVSALSTTCACVSVCLVVPSATWASRDSRTKGTQYLTWKRGLWSRGWSEGRVKRRGWWRAKRRSIVMSWWRSSWILSGAYPFPNSSCSM